MAISNPDTRQNMNIMMNKKVLYILLLLQSFLSCRPIHQNKNSIAQKEKDKTTVKLNWFEKSIFMLHEDHHIKVETEVGKNADPREIARIIALSKPDAIQIHAKGRPGYASYPTKIGWMAPKYERDVLKVWSDIARKDGYHFSIYYNIGRDVEIQTRKPQ
jgi:wyosine [tRNA(Phe)-imidazoG37] synthetase (radical SAM superfamily)